MEHGGEKRMIRGTYLAGSGAGFCGGTGHVPSLDGVKFQKGHGRKTKGGHLKEKAEKGRLSCVEGKKNKGGGGGVSKVKHGELGQFRTAPVHKWMPIVDHFGEGKRGRGGTAAYKRSGKRKNGGGDEG